MMFFYLGKKWILRFIHLFLRPWLGVVNQALNGGSLEITFITISVLWEVCIAKVLTLYFLPVFPPIFINHGCASELYFLEIIPSFFRLASSLKSNQIKSNQIKSNHNKSNEINEIKMTDLSGTIQTIKKKGEGGGGSYQLMSNFLIFTQIFKLISNIKQILRFPHRLSFWETYNPLLFITLASFPNADPAPNLGWSSTWKVLNTFWLFSRTIRT